MKCKAYTERTGVDLTLEPSRVVKYWYSDPLVILEMIKGVIGLKDPFELERISAKVELIEEKYVFGYIVKRRGDSEKVEEVFYVVCAENPDMVYKEIKTIKLQWRSYSTYRYLSTTMLDNYVNVNSIPELESALNESLELINDLIDYSVFSNCSEKLPEDIRKILKEYLSRSTFDFALFFIAYPLSNAILLDLVGGNIIACFLQARLLVEVLVKSLIIDYIYRFKNTPIESIEVLESYLEKEELSVTSVLHKYLSVVLGLEKSKDIVELWKRLSARWAHTKGYVERVRERAMKVEKGELHPALIVPPDMFVTPSTYDEDFKLELKELWITLHDIRRLLCELYTAWTRLLIEYLPEVKECIMLCKPRLLSSIA